MALVTDAEGKFSVKYWHIRNMWYSKSTNETVVDLGGYIDAEYRTALYPRAQADISIVLSGGYTPESAYVALKQLPQWENATDS